MYIHRWHWSEFDTTTRILLLKYIRILTCMQLLIIQTILVINFSSHVSAFFSYVIVVYITSSLHLINAQVTELECVLKRLHGCSGGWVWYLRLSRLHAIISSCIISVNRPFVRLFRVTWFRCYFFFLLQLIFKSHEKHWHKVFLEKSVQLINEIKSDHVKTMKWKKCW